ncbi:MAG: metallophosphoesterase [FCB group bacterium]|nr:metallophosphoesterase [FCB group bacterium]MBL7026911.1 metallophosphoesterase [Candidatus Neomarinimicrobiota bacterium]MBL7120472.1 metallophosphoesterase [Candidatus Neomarinimicrobiota bacterium]
MIKVLFFADSHLGFDFPIRPRIHRRRRGWDFFKNYQLILDTAVEEGVDALVHGGDVFFRSKIPLPIIQKAYEPLLPVLEHGIHMFFVPGNHERSRLPASPVFHHNNFHLFDRPRSFSFDLNGLKTTWGGFPNIRHQVQKEFPNHLDLIGFEKESEALKILCMHQSIEDAVVGAQNYTFRKGPDVVGRDQFPDYLNLVLSGHIHRQQILRSRTGTPLIYSGSIERTSFAERLETKGFFILNLSKDDINWEFRPLPARPMHEMVLASNILDRQNLVRYILDQSEKIPDDAIFRIRSGDEKQLEILKIADLRNVLPESMNIELLPPVGKTRYTWSAYSD